jgi:uncharacterized protein YegJ (DUF2314 family)
MKHALAICLLIVVGLAQAEDRAVDVEPSDRAMNAAIAKAQGSLDRFLDVLDKPPPSATGFTVKVRIAHRDGAEHIWMMPFRRATAGFVGIVANEPDYVPDLHLGQEVAFDRGEITDWGYEVGSKKKGFFTVCAMFQHMSAAEVRQYQMDGYEC